MGFKEYFLKETMTSTGCIAGFSRMTLPLVRRSWMPMWGTEDKPKRKKKVTPQPQVQETNSGRISQ